ncbi:MAG TPA: fused MFS/spermidine synthase [Terracidiphilus sp.]|jgi:spermidine synthase|nr:fused MFS/spermidine synthase [Terracidiphilus sp.]
MTSSNVSAPSTTVQAIRLEALWPYFALFFFSGFPALIYQIVWQRALFTIYGVNIQSVTVIVTVFMLGLGLGSLAGGRLSTLSGFAALRAFGAIEVSIGIFGFLSLPLFHEIAQYTAGASTSLTGIITFVLLLIPTLLMGSTLPLLVAHLVRRTANVGESVGSLYAVNTFGSGAACLVAGWFLMQLLGETGSVRLAACMNLIVGTLGLVLGSREARMDQRKTAKEQSPTLAASATISMQLGMMLAGATGFIALAYEILWYHIYAFTSGGRASSFAVLLGFYLFGIAYGSFAVRDVCRARLKNNLPATLGAASVVVALGTVAAYLVSPAVAFSVSTLRIPYPMTFPFVSIAAALLGAMFPVLCHAAIGPDRTAGKRLSYLYFSNIIGSALGSFIIGFVVLDHLSTATTSLLLLGLGSLLAIILAFLAGPKQTKPMLIFGLAACLCAAAGSHVLFANIFERLMLKWDYRQGTVFRNLVENRSGVIAVDQNDFIFGGGVYDGQFNIDPTDEHNGIFRAYAVSAIHPAPRRVLIIGLSSGSWAQIVAHHPDVESVTIVEINPGYLPLIQQRPAIASLLHNPKVQIVIDDGRRWLVGHPHDKFDFILMNTTFNWRANITNLLSVEFLQLAREHLRPGGVLYYNTTSSGDAQLTGATVFPYALRIANFLAVSDSPIAFDRNRMRSVLTEYRIDSRPAFDRTQPAYQARLDMMVNLPLHNYEDKRGLDWSIEDRSSMLARLRGNRLITDDNMGTEWR